MATKNFTIALTPEEREELELYAEFKLSRGKPITLATALRSIRLSDLAPREGRRAEYRPRGYGKNYERGQYLKEHPEMAGTRRRASEAT